MPLRLLLQGMGLESNIGALIAAMDLRLVQLVRGAMAGGSSVAGERAVHHPQPVIEPRQRMTPEPLIELRHRIEPQPHIEPRGVDHYTPDEKTPWSSTPPTLSDGRVRTLSAFQPPWRTLPWPESPAVEPRIVKIIVKPPDIAHKGSLLDIFI